MEVRRRLWMREGGYELCEQQEVRSETLGKSAGLPTRGIGVRIPVPASRWFGTDTTTVSNDTWAISFILYRLPLPTRTGQRGRRYSTRDNNQDKEIQRRITAGWTAFAKHRDIFKSNIGTCLKRQVYNSCVLLAMTYGAEIWAFTTKAKNTLTAAQTTMERSMLNITYRDRKTNIWVREKTKVTDVIEQVRRRKWTWAGHVSRIRDNRWTLRITTWKGKT
ncbi:hypothetical protein NP493_82g00031 [Ridgeia piscesae]|uniref:Reverse transcriptase domain-containing protein n=1 Tax=Ridgeia piscesae TaxID=27915 RepID=A0AAD9P9B7_RIDPI|nr:hypothetical protein NP493_82g00031 [Ridgeia piscesae]